MSTDGDWNEFTPQELMRMRSCSSSASSTWTGSDVFDGVFRQPSRDLASVSPLEDAVTRYDLEKFADVIDGEDVDVNEFNVDGRNVLHEMLLKYSGLDRLAREEVGDAPITMLTKLLARGLDVNALVQSGPTSKDCKCTALHLAARGDDSGDIIRALLAAGAKVNAADGPGRTPLHLATERSLLGNVKALIEGGANVNSADVCGQTVLHYAVKGRHRPLDVVKTLIDFKADVNAKDNVGKTPVHVAAKYANVKVMKELLASGGRVNKVDGCGQTPVHYAALYDCSGSVLRELLKYTSNINKQTTVSMETALHLAVRHQMTENVISLCASGKADVNIRDIHGETAVHKAVKVKDWSVWLALLKAGGSVRLKTNSGHTALEMLEKQHNSLRSLITNYYKSRHPLV